MSNKLKALAETKFLNLYQANYELENGETLPYVVASRHKLKDFEDLNDTFSTAVHIFAVNSSGTKMLVTDEFRYTVNQNIVDTPAGMIDKGESPEDAAKRELLEETGYNQVFVTEVLQPAYSSAGLTNEMAQSVFAVVNEKVNSGQELDGPEQISAKWLTKKEVSELLEQGNIGARAQMAMKLFVNHALVSTKDLMNANQYFAELGQENYTIQTVRFPNQEPIDVYVSDKPFTFPMNPKLVSMNKAYDDSRFVILGYEIENAKKGKPIYLETATNNYFIPASEASKLVVHNRRDDDLSLDFSEAETITLSSAIEELSEATQQEV